MYADDVNIIGGSMHTVKEKAEVLVVVSKEIWLEVNADKTKYMVMSRDQNAGRNQIVRIDNNIFERVEEFKYLGTNLTYLSSIQEEIKSRLKFSAPFLIQLDYRRRRYRYQERGGRVRMVRIC